MLTVNLLPVWFCRSSLLSEKYWGAPDKKSSPPAKLLKTIGARLKLSAKLWQEYVSDPIGLNRPGFPGECFICELRLPDHRFQWMEA